MAMDDDRSMPAAAPPSERRPVLVLGGTHFIGRATVEALLATGQYDLTLFNRGQTRHPFGQCVTHVKGDRRDPSAVAVVLRSKPRWHAVVDCIAYRSDDLEPIFMHSQHIGLYIVLSTDSVYMACDPNSFVRAPGTGALLEASAGQHHPARGKEDRYGQDKLFLERALRAAAAPEWVALRLPDVLGPHENTGRQHSLLTRLVKGRTIGARTGPDTGARNSPTPGTRNGPGHDTGAINGPDTAPAEPLHAGSFCFGFGGGGAGAQFVDTPSAATPASPSSSPPGLAPLPTGAGPPPAPGAPLPPGQISVAGQTSVAGQISVTDQVSVAGQTSDADQRSEADRISVPAQISVVFAADVGAAIAALLATPRDLLFPPTVGDGGRFPPTVGGGGRFPPTVGGGGRFPPTVGGGGAPGGICEPGVDSSHDCGSPIEAPVSSGSTVPAPGPFHENTTAAAPDSFPPSTTALAFGLFSCTATAPAPGAPGAFPPAFPPAIDSSPPGIIPPSLDSSPPGIIPPALDSSPLGITPTAIDSSPLGIIPPAIDSSPLGIIPPAIDSSPLGITPPAPLSRGISLHLCQRETPAWPELVHSLAGALQACGLHVPAPVLDPLIDTRFLSVDFGPLDGGEARRLLRGWEPAPLAQRVAETAGWWVERMRSSFENMAVAEGGQGGGGQKRRRGVQGTA